MNKRHTDDAMLLKPRSMIGQGIEYTLCGKSIIITCLSNLDSAKRKIEIPSDMLGRFISELQEIERICDK